jgi:hypothetical protein
MTKKSSSSMNIIDTNTELLSELKKIRTDVSTLTNKQQENVRILIKEIALTKEEILAKLEGDDKTRKKGFAFVT